MRVRTMTAIALGAMAMLNFAPMAVAEPNSTIALTVAYSDLNLSSAQDARTMAVRLDHAARRACGGSPRFDADYRLAPLFVQKSFDDCYASAMNAALDHIQAPLVSHAVAELGGRRATAQRYAEAN